MPLMIPCAAKSLNHEGTKFTKGKGEFLTQMEEKHIQRDGGADYASPTLLLRDVIITKLLLIMTQKKIVMSKGER